MQWEKTDTRHVFDRELICKDKELIQLPGIKTNNPIVK